MPCVAIVGRPNVGKSTLFNGLVGRRIAIVEPTRGVTRDRVTAELEVDDHVFLLVDTGGMGIADMDGLTDEVEQQISRAVERADVFVFVVDAREGLQPDDQTIARRLRDTGHPILLAANKVDSMAEQPRRGTRARKAPTSGHEEAGAVADFFALGLGEAIPLSAAHRHGCAELLDAIVEALPEPASGEQHAIVPVEMKLAIVGRRNVGKSTLVNAIAGEERMIVSEVPGTTRDSVDVIFEKDGKRFVAIDTAGVRKRGRLANSIEFYSMVRAQRSIERADVVLFLVDVTEEISDLDKRLAREIADQMKPCVIVGNKWDLAKGNMATSEYADYLGGVLSGLDFAPLTFTTATTGRRVMPTIELAQQLYKQAHTRATTGEVNRVLAKAVAERSPRPRGGRRAKFLYGTQVSVAPPTIIVFVNDTRLVEAPYRRYLANAFRRGLPFPEIPVRVHVRSRRGGAEGA